MLNPRAAPICLLSLWYTLATIWRLVVQGVQVQCQLQLGLEVCGGLCCCRAQAVQVYLLLLPDVLQ